MTTTRSDSSQPHKIRARVYYEDTDAGGIVYHANFLRFAERARTEFLRSLGYDHHQAREEHNIMLVVRHAEIDYKASGELDDWLEVSTEVVEMRNSSMTLKHVISRIESPKARRRKNQAKEPDPEEPKVLVEIKVVLVAISDIGRAVRIPPQLRQIFKG